MQKDTDTTRTNHSRRSKADRSGAGIKSAHDQWRVGARKICLAVVVICILIPLNTCVWAQSSAPTEYEIKAAYLYNFAKHVDWPDDTFKDIDLPFFIGILGEDPFGAALERVIKGKTIEGREIAIRRLSGHASCQLLFISSESANVSKVLETIEGLHIVTVSDLDGFAEKGGVIELFIEENTVRFTINMDAAIRAGVTMDSVLLRLSTVVEEDTDDGTSKPHSE